MLLVVVEEVEGDSSEPSDASWYQQLSRWQMQPYLWLLFLEQNVMRS